MSEPSYDLFKLPAISIDKMFPQDPSVNIQESHLRSTETTSPLCILKKSPTIHDISTIHSHTTSSPDPNAPKMPTPIPIITTKITPILERVIEPTFEKSDKSKEIIVNDHCSSGYFPKTSLSLLLFIILMIGIGVIVWYIYKKYTTNTEHLEKMNQDADKDENERDKSIKDQTL